MKIIQHGNNVWQLTRLFAFNCYLVREDDGFTLIDAGLPGSGNEIIEVAKDLGSPINRIVLTHAHGDHVGSLDEVTSQLPDVEVAMTERSSQFLKGNLSLLPSEPQEKLRGSFYKRITRPSQLLNEGDIVGSLRVLASPGHTPDHISFFDERDRTLIAGDAFQTQGGIAVSGILRWRFPFPAKATWHLTTAIESAKKLRQLNPSRLAVGHGRVLVDPAAKMDLAIQDAEEKTHG